MAATNNVTLKGAERTRLQDVTLKGAVAACGATPAYNLLHADDSDADDGIEQRIPE